MGVMAQDTHAHLYRFVDEALLAKAIVAGVAQFRIVSGSLEFMARAGLKRSCALLGHVTSIAPVLYQWLVDTFMLHYRRVTT